MAINEGEKNNKWKSGKLFEMHRVLKLVYAPETPSFMLGYLCAYIGETVYLPGKSILGACKER